MLVSIIGLRQYYSEMEGKENYRRGMAVCARKVRGGKTETLAILNTKATGGRQT